jgi:hypothetical protein
MENWQPDVIAGMYLGPGAVLFAAGVVLDQRRHSEYAWPLSFVGLILIVVSLSGIALSNNTLFGWLLSRKLPFLNEAEHHFLSFLCNGLLYLGLAGICRLLGTPLQRSLANVLNWLGPAHILVSLRMLDLEGACSSAHSLVYRFLLPIVSLGLVFGSVVRQMKSFFYSGMGGIAASVHKFTVEHLDKYFAWPVSLILTGIVWMLVSWLVPRWKDRPASRKQ